MDITWSLDSLYTSFESEKFKEDKKEFISQIETIKAWTYKELENSENFLEKIEAFIQLENEFFNLFTKLYSYAELSLSVDAKNEEAMKTIENIEEIMTKLTTPQVQFEKWLSSLENIEDKIKISNVLKEHAFYISEIKNKSSYLLSEKEEVLLAKMKNTGSNAWTKLQEKLTSTLLVEMKIEGKEKKLPLPIVRNMAYDKDENVRKNAYEAELNAYKKIEDASAASLNGIKGEVITLCKLRGYSSPLEKTLMDSRMDKKTLEAMLTAIEESLPVFHKYYKKKGNLLGHENGLPFYDLFAPMGKGDRQFTYEEAKEYIVNHFRSFSDKLGDYAKHAFENRWIDATPREGKRGGAFCQNIHGIKESRILSNFTGSFSDVTTLAHELGHGYHGECLKEETYLNSNYPMPIAETASIFCETIIKNAALKNASKEEAFTMLENDISDAGQVIVDIYSRFLFEKEVFERREEGSLSVEKLKEIMIKAQKKAYGEGLDHNILHPYMWVCKPHYYYANENFYNFPYAFGLLFAKGLYAKYLKEGNAFVKEYDHLLSITGKNNIVDIAKTAKVDIHSPQFWKNALKLIEKDIEKFINIG